MAEAFRDADNRVFLPSEQLVFVWWSFVPLETGAAARKPPKVCERVAAVRVRSWLRYGFCFPGVWKCRSRLITWGREAGDLFGLFSPKPVDVIGEAPVGELDTDLGEALVDGDQGVPDVKCGFDIRPSPADLAGNGSWFLCVKSAQAVSGVYE
jgi:hypothetical protein